jgi:hypothetical protein
MKGTAAPTPVTLNGVPAINVVENLRLAATNGRRISGILREVVTLRREPGKLGSQASSSLGKHRDNRKGPAVGRT